MSEGTQAVEGLQSAQATSVGGSDAGRLAAEMALMGTLDTALAANRQGLELQNAQATSVGASSQKAAFAAELALNGGLDDYLNTMRAQDAARQAMATTGNWVDTVGKSAIDPQTIAKLRDTNKGFGGIA